MEMIYCMRRRGMVGDKDERFNSDFFALALDQLNTNIYITDIETDEIVYMNKTMQDTFQLEEPIGKICWQVLQKGMKQRCDFCKVPNLMNGKHLCIWDENNTVTERIYKNYSSLLQWNGKNYHIQNSTDVTEYTELSEIAIRDELTQMLNRRAGKERLEELIAKAKKEQKILAIALYDINDLKQVNDRYGHREGDRLLRYTAETTKQFLNYEDCVFRLSGDEFVLIFYDENMVNAEKRMRTILKQLLADRQKSNIFYEASFSFGLILVYPEEDNTVLDIINRADEKMYIQKRNYHIRKAKQKLHSLESAEGKMIVKSFEYDRDQLFEALSANSSDYLFIGNLKSGVFQYAPAMVEEFGLPATVVENAAAFWGELIHPQDESIFLESNQEIADGRADHHCIEYRAKNAKGEWIQLRCKGRMTRDAKGMPELFAGFISNLGKKRTESNE